MSPVSGFETPLIRISIVTVAFNAARTLPATLQSVAQQGWPNVEHWLIDGGSTDNTAEVVRKHGGHLAGFVSEPDEGLYDALNKGISRCTGDIIGILHADDVFASPCALASIAKAFEDPEIDAVYADLEYVDKKNAARVIRYWHAGEFQRTKLHWGWMPPHPTLYVRREIYQRIGGFDTSYRVAADYDFVLRLFSDRHLRTAYVPRVVVRMRVGGLSNRSLSNILRKSREDLRALRHHGIGGLAALACKNLRKIGGFFQRAPQMQT